MADLSRILLKMNVNRRSEFLPFLEKELKKFSDEDVARFLANAFVETSKFYTLRENLYYSSPQRLLAFFPSAFAPKPKGQGYNPLNYIKNPQKLGNLIYNSNLIPEKRSLGNFSEGAGFKYRGAGILQTTGYENFLKLSQTTKIDFVKNPELLEQPEWAVKSAVIYYTSNKISEKKTLEEVRRAVNGSLAGYKEFINYYNEIKKYI